MNPHPDHPPQLPDVDERAGHDDPLDALLTQIINGFFVLTDGQGAVSKWSEPAELLFGLDAAEGARASRSSSTLVDHAPPEAEAWRRFLEHGEAPRTSALQVGSAIYAGGQDLPARDGLRPGQARRGLRLLALPRGPRLRAAGNLMLLRMRQQHPVVVRALRQALETEPQPWDGWRTAGTLVAFRPTAADALGRGGAGAAREAARAEADIEGEERLDPDPGIQGDSIADLEDAAAVVARLISALERIEDLEKTAADLPVALEEARREAQAAATAPRRPSRRSTRRASSSSASATRSAGRGSRRAQGAARAHRPPRGEPRRGVLRRRRRADRAHRAPRGEPGRGHRGR